MSPQKLTNFRTIRVLMFWLPRLVLCICALLLFGMFVPFWPTELIISFAPQVVFILLSLSLLTIVTYMYSAIRIDNFHTHPRNIRDTIMVIVSFIVLIAVAGIIFNRGMQDGLSMESGQGLRLATFNMLYSNDDTATISAQLKESAVAVAGFQEIMPHELEAIRSSLGFKYSYNTDADMSAYETEIGIISKFPIVRAETMYGYENGGILRAELNVDGKIYSVLVVHLTPPYSFGDFARRGDLMNRLSSVVVNEAHPTFIMGDFNTTVFSPHLNNFMEQTKQRVKMASKRQLPECSWFGYGDGLCMRIDHIFVPNDLNIHDVTIGEYAGSDHRPVIVDVAY